MDRTVIIDPCSPAFTLFIEQIPRLKTVVLFLIAVELMECQELGFDGYLDLTPFCLMFNYPCTKVITKDNIAIIIYGPYFRVFDIP